MNYTKGGIPLQHYSCGCYVAQWGDNSCGIEYCPQHKAAPDMYIILADIAKALDEGKERIGAGREMILRQALAKTEGRT